MTTKVIPSVNNAITLVEIAKVKILTIVKVVMNYQHLENLTLCNLHVIVSQATSM